MRSLTLPIGGAGALIEVQIGVDKLRRAAMHRAGHSAPPGVHVQLLVDTGASHTFVDEGVMRTLQLQPTSTAGYHSASTQGVAQRCNVFDVGLSIGSTAHNNLWRLDPIQVMANPFINQPHQGLLGRDVLGRLQLHWNGPAQRLVLNYA